MRPVAIQLSAFGPFAGSQRIDFNELAGNRLFLITGPTGSGKTTLMDAMCFALYGDTSGAERDGKQMRSDHAGPEVLTEVVFDFALGARQFRVRRIPEQERAKRRGDGTTKQKSDATLWDRTGAGEDAEGVILATGWTDVSSKVEGLVGFSSEQFRQVIMLPQGKFRELLTANSEQREAILQNLFQTNLFLAIQRALKDNAAEIRRRSEKLAEKRGTLLEQLGVEDEQALRERLASLANQVGELETALGPLRQAERDAATALYQGNELVRKFIALAEAETMVRDLKVAEREFQEKRQQLERADKAASLDDIYKQLQDAREREIFEGSRLQEAITAASATVAAVEAAQIALVQEERKEFERRALQQEIGDLQRYSGDAQGIASARSAVALAEAALIEAKENQVSARMALDETKMAQTELAPRLAGARDKAARLDGLRQSSGVAAKRLEDHRYLAAARAESAVSANARGEAMARCEAANTVLAAAKQRLRDLEQALMEGQAAVLAATLVDGELCPVCGSAHHPQPALAGARVPGSEDVEAARESLDEAEGARGRASDAVQGVEKAIALAKQKEEILEEALGEAVTWAVGELEAAAERAKQDLEAAALAKQAIAGMETEVSTLAAQQAEREAELGKVTDELGKLKGELAASKAALGEREAKVPERWRTPGAAEHALDEAKQALDRSRKALKEAQEQGSEALKKQSSAATSVDESSRVHAESAQALDNLSTQWEERVGKLGFSAEKQYLDARQATPERERLRGDLKTYDDSVRDAGERVKLAQEAVARLSRPEIAVLEQAEAKARGARETAEKEKTRLETTLAGEKQVEEVLARTAGELEKARNQFAVIGRLSEVANGKNSFRLSFQRFVLTALLDDVLIAASNRLERMSKGRYRLERVTIQGDQRVQGGLDLQVEDGYTGKVRPVSSLSGGESFLAALSLALGLAEVVEAYAGGVRLDTIFIDEGFGSLDPEALDLAVNTLVDLQSQGRLVGIISHVPELKERIDVRLELTSTRGRSAAAFALP